METEIRKKMRLKQKRLSETEKGTKHWICAIEHRVNPRNLNFMQETLDNIS